MVYVILQGNAPQAQRIRELKDSLILATNAVNRINRELDQMTDADAIAQYGATTETIASMRTTIDNAKAALETAGIQAIISQVGFNQS